MSLLNSITQAKLLLSALQSLEKPLQSIEITRPFSKTVSVVAVATGILLQVLLVLFMSGEKLGVRNNAGLNGILTIGGHFLLIDGLLEIRHDTIGNFLLFHI